MGKSAFTSHLILAQAHNTRMFISFVAVEETAAWGHLLTSPRST